LGFSRTEPGPWRESQRELSDAKSRAAGDQTGNEAAHP